MGDTLLLYMNVFDRAVYTMCYRLFVAPAALLRLLIDGLAIGVQWQVVLYLAGTTTT